MRLSIQLGGLIFRVIRSQVTTPRGLHGLSIQQNLLNSGAYQQAALKNRSPIKYCVQHGTEQELGHIRLSTQSSGPVELRWDHDYGTVTHGIFKRRPEGENVWDEIE